jgi:coenzyme F420-reducing hydrogenase gamma subunit
VRPRIAVFKFASCDGCQLQLLNLEHELLALSERIDIVHFLEATSRVEEGPYDISFVEGSITTEADAERIRAVREASRQLVTIGACATSGGIQHLRNTADVEAWKAAVYPRPDEVAALATSTPISEHVSVDAELQGCPVNPDQLVQLIARALLSAAPELPGASVCLECKRQGNVCVVVTKGLPCMGPVTRAGCGALCPSLGRDCYACFGPSEQPNATAQARLLASQGETPRRVAQRFRGINGQRREFRRMADHLEGRDG